MSLIIYFLLFFAVSIIFIGNLSQDAVAFAGAISLVVAFLVRRLGYKIPLRELRIFGYLKYLAVLIPSIYISAVRTLLLCVRHKGNPQTTVIETSLKTKKPFGKMLVCSAITLTPGTVTTEMNGQRIKVLKFSDGSANPAEEFDNALNQGRDIVD